MNTFDWSFLAVLGHFVVFLKFSKFGSYWWCSQCAKARIIHVKITSFFHQNVQDQNWTSNRRSFETHFGPWRIGPELDVQKTFFWGVFWTVIMWTSFSREQDVQYSLCAKLVYFGRPKDVLIRSNPEPNFLFKLPLENDLSDSFQLFKF